MYKKYHILKGKILRKMTHICPICDCEHTYLVCEVPKVFVLFSGVLKVFVLFSGVLKVFVAADCSLERVCTKYFNHSTQCYTGKPERNVSRNGKNPNVLWGRVLHTEYKCSPCQNCTFIWDFYVNINFQDAVIALCSGKGERWREVGGVRARAYMHAHTCMSACAYIYVWRYVLTPSCHACQC